MNRTEQITYELCKKSFLSFWSHANPLRADGKELCDVFVVFDPHIVIFSVKEIQYPRNAKESVALRRWERRAVERSAKQIYKAQKWVALNRVILTSDKKPIPMPDARGLRIHRVAVALGSEGKAPIGSGDFGKGYVHVHDEVSIHRTLRELDTITDFVDYLTAVESLSKRITRAILDRGQEDLLVLYLENNRSFPDKVDILVIQGDMWKEFQNRPEVKKRREEDRISYLWDFIIEELSGYTRDGELEYESKPGETELVLRTMAKENRFSRRVLSQQLDDILRTTPKTHRRAKLLQSPSGVIYVLLVSEKGRDREDRRRELEYRCYVAKNMFPSSPTVVGLATEHYDPAGHSFDVCYLRFEEWTKEQQEWAREAQGKLGFFTKARRDLLHVEEYPGIDKTDSTEPKAPPEDIGVEKFRILQEKFPLTLEHLSQSEEFDAIGHQLALEGYKGWEVLEAGCNIVLSYRVDPGGNKTLAELADRIAEHAKNYVESAYSPFPPAGCFTLKRVRGQVHVDRATRLLRSKELSQPMAENVPVKEVEERRDPQNCLYARTKDNYDLWMVLFPKFHNQTERISTSEEWRIRIGCDSKDSVSFVLCDGLARDLAKYATMIDFWISRLKSARKEELNIVVYDEKLFEKLFPSSYLESLQGRQEIDGTPIVMSWLDSQGKPHMKLAVNETIAQQPRMRRLFYAMCGILDCVGGMPKPEAAKKSAELVETLE